MSAAHAAASRAARAGPPLSTDPDDDDEGGARTRPLEWRLIKRIFDRTRPYTRRRNLLLALVALRAILLPLIGYAVGALLAGPVARHDVAGTLRGALAFLGLVLATEIGFHFRMRLALELGEAVVHDLRRDVFSHLLAMPLGYFQARSGRIGRIISRTVSDVDAIRVGVQDVAFMGVVQLGTMLVAGVLMALADLTLFLVVLAFAPILWWLLARLRARLSDAHRAVHESFARVTATLAEAVTGVRVTQGFVREAHNAALFRDLIAHHSRNNMEVVERGAIFLPLLELLSQTAVGALIALGGARVLGREMELGTLVQFLFLAQLFFNPLPVLGNLGNQALAAMAAAERVFALLDTQPAWADPPGARRPPRLAGRVEARGLGFAYEPGRPVLEDVTFVAEPGMTVALVGPTGGGKSTLMSLLAKLHLPTRGDLLIDGEDVRQLDGQALRAQMGTVPQSTFLFGGTVLDNVRIGRPDARDGDIVAAARALGVEDLIEALPAGLQTRVGEKGAGLSLGQRQVVAFLRAMLAEPRILLLDEATSAVDALTEARLQEALRTLLRGRTTFVVAHRLSTIRGADLVLVLDRGRIVERGPHRDLVRGPGLYASLYRTFTDTGSVADPSGPG